MEGALISTGWILGMDCEGWAFVGDCCVEDVADEPALGEEIGAFMVRIVFEDGDST